MTDSDIPIRQRLKIRKKKYNAALKKKEEEASNALRKAEARLEEQKSKLLAKEQEFTEQKESVERLTSEVARFAKKLKDKEQKALQDSEVAGSSASTVKDSSETVTG